MTLITNKGSIGESELKRPASRKTTIATTTATLATTKPSTKWRFLTSGGLLSITLVLLGVFLLGADVNQAKHRGLRSLRQDTSRSQSKKDDATVIIDDWSLWVDTSGIELSHIVGDPTKCTEVIYTGDTRDPMAQENNATFVAAGWKGMLNVVSNFNNAVDSKIKNKIDGYHRDHDQTTRITATTPMCLVFFKIATPFISMLNDTEQAELHPVWGRLPATALVMSTFQKANYFLYMDTDALLAFPDDRARPSIMYKTLSYDGFGENPSYKYKHPGLIANKPGTGWMCSQCEIFGLGHGCFNTGALLWRRSNAAKNVLKAWWKSRLLDESHNLFRTTDDGGTEAFPFWDNANRTIRLRDKMAEQARLHFVYATNPIVQEAVWPVPQQRSDSFNSTSCPNQMDKMPCLQFDFLPRRAYWDRPDGKPSCFINHYADKKDIAIKQAALMLQDNGKREKG